uniref:Rab GTPase-binding effector protein 1 n=1 Tax=Aceria tosichella TaxID=561515 RepID=A0A6G1SCE9_9ACAR
MPQIMEATTKSSAPCEHGPVSNDGQNQPVVETLIDVDTDVTNIVKSEPPTPTNTPSLVIPTPKTTAELEAVAASSQSQGPPPPPTQAFDNNNKVELQKGSLPTIDEIETSQTSNTSKVCDIEKCPGCNKLELELNRLRAEKLDLEHTLGAVKAKLQLNKDELEREVQRRVDLEQRFTEEAKRTTDQIEELIAKSDSDDARLNELRKRFELYSRETSSMIENFTTSREVLASQLLELRQENDHLLGKYLSKSRDLQNADINLPQNVEELQFHCLTLYEKLILSTMAKERLEETLMQNDAQSSMLTQESNSGNAPGAAPT